MNDDKTISQSDDTYTCAACGGVFDKGWSDEEAWAEKDADARFADTPREDCAVICDDCYKRMVPAL